MMQEEYQMSNEFRQVWKEKVDKLNNDLKDKNSIVSQHINEIYEKSAKEVKTYIETELAHIDYELSEQFTEAPAVYSDFDMKYKVVSQYNFNLRPYVVDTGYLS